MIRLGLQNQRKKESVNHRLTSTWFVTLSLVRTWCVPLPVCDHSQGVYFPPNRRRSIVFRVLFQQTNKQINGIYLRNLASARECARSLWSAKKFGGREDYMPALFDGNICQFLIVFLSTLSLSETWRHSETWRESILTVMESSRNFLYAFCRREFI